MSVAWTPRGDLLVGSSDGTVRSIGTDGRKQFEVAAGNEIFNLAVAPDGSTFASSLPVRLWSVADGSRVRGLGQWGQGGVAWAPDGSLLAIADWGAGGLALDPGNGEVRDTLRAPQSTGGQGPSGRVPFEVNMPLTSVAFSGNGDWLAAGGADRKIWLWSVTSGRVGPGDGSREHPMSVTGVAFSPDGRLLASASLDGGIRLWDVPAR
jgi:WD40 repeat protein